MSRDEDKINSLVAEIRVLESALNDLNARQNVLERILIDSRTSIETINGLDSTKSDEGLIPIGAGVLLWSPPPKVDKVLVNIGANVVVEKSKEDATSFMEKRVREIEESLANVISQRNQIAQRLDSDNRAAQSILSRQGQ